MKAVHLPSIDLNLLVALDALLEERSVTRAAKRMGVTQPAMSHALSRLRELFDDPLLVRTNAGMVATERAKATGPRLRRLLGDVSAVIGTPPAFDPETEARVFRIALSDYAQFVLLPPLLERLRERAPRVSITALAVPADPQDALESGRTDLVLLGRRALPEADLLRQSLFEDTMVCVVRKDHPRVGRSLTVEDYAALDHAFIAPRAEAGAGVIERALEELGLARRIVLRVPQFVIAPWVVSRSDLVLTAPRRMAIPFAEALPLRIVECPVKLPTFDMSQFWHARQQDDPAHVFLRTQIAEVARRKPADATTIYRRPVTHR
jgi:DNA-binding transcriptional LysR family regulator